MLISPELYYEENLKAKSVQEIKRRIRLLKMEINKLKKELESDCPRSSVMIMPSPLTRISVYRDYLDRAKLALEEAGGNYEPTYAEKREIAFNESLDNIKSIIFNLENYRHGSEVFEASITGDDVSCLRYSTFRPYEETWTTPKSELTDALKIMHIGEWKRNYYNHNVLDGIGWCLDIRYDNGHRRICFSGSNSFPYNFDELLDFFEIEFNDDSSAELRRSGFDNPTIGTIHPKGSKIINNKDGTISIVPPDKPGEKK